MIGQNRTEHNRTERLYVVEDAVRKSMEGSMKQGRVAYLLHHGCWTIFTNAHWAEFAYVLQIYAPTVVTKMSGTTPISTIIFYKV